MEAASKKRSSNRVSKPGNPPRKKKASKKKSDAVSARSCLVLIGVEELLLVARAFVKVSNNAKQFPMKYMSHLKSLLQLQVK